MPSLKKMRSRTDMVKVEWGDESVTVTWRPGMLTDRFMEKLAAVYDDARTGRVADAMPKVRAHLATLITEWDLTEEEGPVGPGNPAIPINADSLADIPEGLLLRITGKLLDEGREGEAFAPSGSGGLPGAQPGTSRDGPHSFE